MEDSSFSRYLYKYVPVQDSCMGTSWELGLYYRFEYYRRQYLDRYHDLLASAESETRGVEAHN